METGGGGRSSEVPWSDWALSAALWIFNYFKTSREHFEIKTNNEALHKGKDNVYCMESITHLGFKVIDFM